MASMGIDGIVSGLDTTALINSLMQAEAMPQTLLKSKVTTAGTFISALQSLNTRISSFGDAAKVYMCLQARPLGPFARADLAEFFPSRTREYETEEPNDGGMGYVYPDEKDGQLYAGMVANDVSHKQHRYWLCGTSRLDRKTDSPVLGPRPAARSRERGSTGTR